MLYRSHTVLILKGIKNSYRNHAKSLARYESLRDETKVQLAVEGILSDKGLKAITINLNLSPSLEVKLNTNKTSSLNYVRDQVRKIIKKAIPDTPPLFLLVLERSAREKNLPGGNGSKPHFHGILALPLTKATDEIIERLRLGLDKSPLTSGYRERYGHTRVLLQTTYEQNVEDGGIVLKPINSGWGSYITKQLPSERHYVISQELTAKTKAFLKEMVEHDCSVSCRPHFK